MIQILLFERLTVSFLSYKMFTLNSLHFNSKYIRLFELLCCSRLLCRRQNSLPQIAIIPFIPFLFPFPSYPYHIFPFFYSFLSLCLSSPPRSCLTPTPFHFLILRKISLILSLPSLLSIPVLLFHPSFLSISFINYISFPLSPMILPRDSPLPCYLSSPSYLTLHFFLSHLHY